MQISDAFPGNYIKAADLKGRRVSVQIAKVALEEIGGENKLVMSFVGKDKSMVLNKTNATTISDICGSTDTDHWVGKNIVIFPTKTEFQGKRVDCIRVDDPPRAPAAAPARPTPPPSAPDFDQDKFDDPEIPF